ncbi:glycosyltransferase [Amycolatopsis albispora]|uniref:MGT family glycosyltransferase n=1 Tax=Amycolatopsis albispora TaxID=1804986 RepID=A0A344LM42_9PSEU|nr:glycosyltransferase [Amycolatopsis albispora]AXB49116.1 MGT family glycosyltransferase [Amycolatopsis albispora]
MASEKPSQRPILFVSYSESGLLNPMLVLAEELSRRGVPNLWFATDENRRSAVEGLNAGSPVEFFSLGDPIPELSSTTWDDETYRLVTQKSKFKARRAVIEQTDKPRLRVPKYRKLEEAVEKIDPALLVVESMCRFGIELAITKRIPYVLSVPFVPSNVLTSYVPIGKSYTPKGFPIPHSGLPFNGTFAQRVRNKLFGWRTLTMAMSKDMKARQAEDAKVREELGIAPEAFGQFARVEKSELVLCNTIPELDYPFELPEKVRAVGAMVPPLPESDDTELADWLSAQDSVIYMGFGTITRLTAEQVGALVEVARRLDGRHQVLWKLPAEQQKWLPPADQLPGNLRIENWVPSQLDVLAHPNVKLFFSHGGGNAYNEGVYFGKPQVMRPLWVDCYDQAVRGESFGISLTLDRPRDMDVGDVVDKLTRVLGDSSFRTRAERLSRLQREAGGREKAADLILGLPAMAKD